MRSKSKEGDVFAVPLRSGGYAVGLIARIAKNNSGGMLGYFFYPKYHDVPSQAVIESLQPAAAIKAIIFGDLSILRGEWPVVGAISDWNRERWPMPEFIRKDDISRKAWKVKYSEDDLSTIVSEQPEAFDSPLERDAVYGAGAVELLLTKLLAGPVRNSV